MNDLQFEATIVVSVVYLICLWCGFGLGWLFHELKTKGKYPFKRGVRLKQ